MPHRISFFSPWTGSQEDLKVFQDLVAIGITSAGDLKKKIPVHGKEKKKNTHIEFCTALHPSGLTCG